MKASKIIVPIVIGLTAGAIGYVATALFSGTDGDLYLNTENGTLFTYLNKRPEQYKPGTKIVLRYKVPDVAPRAYNAR